MKKISLLFVLLFTTVHTLSAQTLNIEKVDSSLIGLTIKDAIQILNVKENWWVITEPPGILRGVWINYNDSCQIVLTIERTFFMPKHKSKNYQKMQYEAIKNKPIVYISWEIKGCN